jgi:SAM-dependent methyltransferase
VTDLTQKHWDGVYTSKRASEVSWYEPRASKSLELVRATGLGPEGPIIDVGAGASLLSEELLGAGHRDVTALDISAVALEKLRERLQDSRLTLLHQDVLTFEPSRAYALWHDRAVFHFLTRRADRERYVDVLARALPPGGHLIMATFGPEGPERCSGLPTQRYDPVALARELGPGFQLMESTLNSHRTPWQTVQQFVYCRFERREN